MSRDADSYLQRFTPRRAGSSWSRRNTEHVEALLEEGLMREAGMLHVRAAQADGRWASAYAPSSEMALPPDFLAELEANPAAKEFFETLSKSSRYVIYHRLQTAKQADTRQRRLEKFVALLTNREKPT
ncbi:MAG: YdeI/OmpD-associated family protein [Caldilineaceae bacterium]|nr:YdeI/OmpD-associated family protein [Caldilineaceae bacterium]